MLNNEQVLKTLIENMDGYNLRTPATVYLKDEDTYRQLTATQQFPHWQVVDSRENDESFEPLTFQDFMKELVDHLPEYCEIAYQNHTYRVEKLIVEDWVEAFHIVMICSKID